MLRVLLLARLAQGFQDLFMNVYPDHPSSRATFVCLHLIWELAKHSEPGEAWVRLGGRTCEFMRDTPQTGALPRTAGQRTHTTYPRNIREMCSFHASVSLLE